MTQETPKTESELSTAGDDAYALTKRIFSVVDVLRFSLWWGIALWAFTGIAAILSLVGVLDGQSFLVGILWAVGLVIWIFGPFMLFQMRAADKVLKDWKGNYLAYSHIVSFELSPKEDQDLAHDVVRLLTEIRAIKPGPIENLGKKPRYEAEYSAEIDGKRGTYKFDALLFTPVEIGFVRVYPDPSRKVGVEDIKTIAEQVGDVIKRQKMDILEVVAVSRAGFTEEAVKHASSSENWIGSEPNRDAVNLIHATPDGYSITWMQYPRSR